jgi:hypothetical protein
MAIVLFILFIALQIADAWTTLRVLARAGREANPIMAWVFDRVGVAAGLLLTKGAASALVAWGLLDRPGWLAALCAFYAAVVAHNLRALYR